MNVFKTLIVAVACLLGCASCNGSQKQDAAAPKQQAVEGGKTLIVFFSHAGENYSVGNIEVGNTKLVAQEIQKVTGADTFEIVPEKDYDMPYNQLTRVAKAEAQSGELPAFKGEVKNLDQYSTVFIGGPIWWGTYPRVMFTFFSKYDLNGKRLIPFTTHEGSGLGNVVSDLKQQYPKANVTNAFSIAGHEVRGGQKQIDAWLHEAGY